MNSPKSDHLKKIVYISNSYNPSISANFVHVHQISLALAKGHQLTVFFKKEPLSFSPQHDKKPYKARIIPHINIRGWNFFYGLIAAFYSKLLRSDLVISRHFIGAYLCVLLGKKVILELHAPLSGGLEGKNSKRLKKIIQKNNFLKLVVITQSLRDHYEKHYPEISQKIEVIPDAANEIPKNTQVIDEIVNNQRPQIGYVGHLYPGKGMEIISKIAIMCPEMDFHVVGGAEKDLKKWKENCQDVPNIIFWGHRSHQEVSRFLVSFDIVLLPNQKNVQTSGSGLNIGSWTSPLKAFEYMAAQKPIIASNLPVLREIFHDRVNAILCNPDLLDEWKQALEMLSSDQQLCQSLAKNSYHDFIRNYTWDIRARKVLAVNL